MLLDIFQFLSKSSKPTCKDIIQRIPLSNIKTQHILRLPAYLCGRVINFNNAKRMILLANEILDLISKGEAETLEFKRSTGLMREGIETLCALANHRGGYLLFGVDDDGSILRQEVTDDTIKNIANSVKLNTDPKLYPTIKKPYLKAKIVS